MISFFHENEEYGCFSNWYPAQFEYAGQQFANSEQFMMYHKVLMFHKHDLARQIMETAKISLWACALQPITNHLSVPASRSLLRCFPTWRNI